MTIKRLAVTLTGLTLALLLGAVLNDRTAHAREMQTVLRAQSIELVDGSGRVRAQLDVSPDGEVVFRLRDAKGTIRVKLAASEAGSGLLLANERTEPGVHILAQRTQTSVLLQRGAKRRVLKLLTEPGGRREKRCVGAGLLARPPRPSARGSATPTSWAPW
jgi:hypothetical protein